MSLPCCSNDNILLTRIALDSGSGSGNPAIRPFFFKIRPKSNSSRIWQIPMQLPYVQLITVKTNAADLSSRVFAVSISVTWMIKNTKFIAMPQISSVM